MSTVLVKPEQTKTDAFIRPIYVTGNENKIAAFKKNPNMKRSTNYLNIPTASAKSIISNGSYPPPVLIPAMPYPPNAAPYGTLPNACANMYPPPSIIYPASERCHRTNKKYQRHYQHGEQPLIHYLWPQNNGIKNNEKRRNFQYNGLDREIADNFLARQEQTKSEDGQASEKDIKEGSEISKTSKK